MIIMESERLYQVQKEDLPKLEDLLTQCFKEDPLYHSLIPNKEVRERLMPPRSTSVGTTPMVLPPFAFTALPPIPHPQYNPASAIRYKPRFP